MASKPYIIDYNTTNTSFVKWFFKLKELGIKNHSFHLVLYDKNLTGIDPFDPNLSPELRQRIMLECTINPWYYFRECVYVPDCGGKTRFQANRLNLASMYISLKNHDQYMTSVPQHGRVTSALVVLSWVHLFGSVQDSISLMDNTRQHTTHKVEWLEEIMRYLPSYMQPKLQKGSNPSNPWSYKHNKMTGNRIVTPFIPRNNIEAMEYSDEIRFPVHFYNNVELNQHVFTLAELSRKNMREFKDRAYKNNTPSFRTITSVVVPVKDRTQAWQAERLISYSLKWNDTLYDMTDAELQDHVRKNSPTGFIYLEGSIDYFGYTQEWVDKQSEYLNHNPDKIQRELHLQRY